MSRLDLASLNSAPDLARALQSVWPRLPGARLVGGVVRDLLAGLPVADLDLGTPDPPETVVRRLEEAGLRVIATGLAHGTVTALVQKEPVQITTLRRDEESFGRHARVAWTDDWQVDAARRDFTINAMSVDPDGLVHDYFGGRDDLAAGRVRFVGEAGLRIVEDALRTLRFFRFQARFGRGAPDPASVAAIGGALPRLDGLSGERVWWELRRILTGPRPDEIVGMMDELGVLGRLLPGTALTVPGRLHALPGDAVLRLSCLFSDGAEKVAGRLRLSGDETLHLAALLAPSSGAEVSDDDVRRQLADASSEVLEGRAWRAEARDADGRSWQALRDTLRRMERPVFPLAGRDVLALGLPAGPRVGQLLEATRRWWLDRFCLDDAAACRTELARLAGAILPPKAPGC